MLPLFTSVIVDLYWYIYIGIRWRALLQTYVTSSYDILSEIWVTLVCESCSPAYRAWLSNPDDWKMAPENADSVHSLFNLHNDDVHTSNDKDDSTKVRGPPRFRRTACYIDCWIVNISAWNAPAWMLDLDRGRMSRKRTGTFGTNGLLYRLLNRRY